MIEKPCPLKEGHLVNDFQCGVDRLDLYLKQYARQSQKRDRSRTYVALKANRVIGFYTLIFGAIEQKDIPDYVKKGLGKYPIPVLIIARLAVDKNWAGKGLGNSLLLDALRQAIIASDIAGLKAVVVNAKNNSVKKFYEKRGFREWPIDSNRLFITIAELKKEAKF